MTELALVHGQVDEPSLADLAVAANREHEHVVEAATAMVQHAITAGEALLAAKGRTAPGDWTTWLEENFVGSHPTALVYMTIAYHQDAVMANPKIKTIRQARRYLRELGAVREPHGQQGRGVYVSEARREEARAMRQEGATIREIADALGHQVSTVHGWLNPESVEQRRHRQAKSKARRREAQRALRRQERDRAARKIGGTVADCYSMVRKTAQALDWAIAEADDRETRAALNLALTKLHGAEDAVVRALGIS